MIGMDRVNGVLVSVPPGIQQTGRIAKGKQSITSLEEHLGEQTLNHSVGQTEADLGFLGQVSKRPAALGAAQENAMDARGDRREERPLLPARCGWPSCLCALDVDTVEFQETVSGEADLARDGCALQYITTTGPCRPPRSVRVSVVFAGYLVRMVSTNSWKRPSSGTATTQPYLK